MVLIIKIMYLIAEKNFLQMLKKFGSNIISIDGTHGTIGYDFTLTTLMVVEDYAMGIPVAFCISNRERAGVFSIFFNVIKKECGKINAKVFMSDDFPAYNKEWTKVVFCYIGF